LHVLLWYLWVSLNGNTFQIDDQVDEHSLSNYRDVDFMTDHIDIVMAPADSSSLSLSLAASHADNVAIAPNAKVLKRREQNKASKAARKVGAPYPATHIFKCACCCRVFHRGGLLDHL
jgi:hypothetical protein